VEGDNCPRPVFPKKAINRHVDPHLQQEFGGKICRAIKANRMITSIEFPGICSRVCKNLDQDHACIPVMFSGGIFMIAQFVFDKIPPEKHASLNRRLQMATEFLDASRNVLETKQLLGELRESAIRDSLTKLHNRRFLTEIMDSIIPAVVRRGEKLALAMCDIDHFKEINDQYGHDAGDIMLRAIAETIKQCGRNSDMIIRYGGEEFLAIFRDLDDQDPLLPAERIRQCCAENVVNYKGAALSRTISLGVSIFPDDTADIWEAIHLADQALLQAKKSGRNRVVRYQHAKTDKPDERPH
jgi:diguanylate cyclase (GGDEF)-like protein